ncbi:hypothetical protein ACLB2K_028952 [Fragaria x ananassa]
MIVDSWMEILKALIDCILGSSFDSLGGELVIHTLCQLNANDNSTQSPPFLSSSLLSVWNEKTSIRFVLRDSNDNHLVHASKPIDFWYSLRYEATALREGLHTVLLQHHREMIVDSWMEILKALIDCILGSSFDSLGGELVIHTLCQLNANDNSTQSPPFLSSSLLSVWNEKTSIRFVLRDSNDNHLVHASKPIDFWYSLRYEATALREGLHTVLLQHHREMIVDSWMEILKALIDCILGSSFDSLGGELVIHTLCQLNANDNSTQSPPFLSSSLLSVWNEKTSIRFVLRDSNDNHLVHASKPIDFWYSLRYEATALREGLHTVLLQHHREMIVDSWMEILKALIDCILGSSFDSLGGELVIHTLCQLNANDNSTQSPPFLSSSLLSGKLYMWPRQATAS